MEPIVRPPAATHLLSMATAFAADTRNGLKGVPGQTDGRGSGMQAADTGRGSGALNSLQWSNSPACDRGLAPLAAAAVEWLMLAALTPSRLAPRASLLQCGDACEAGRRAEAAACQYWPCWT